MDQLQSIDVAHEVAAPPGIEIVSERRVEPRYEGLVESAILSFRGQDHRVPVMNISSRGTMIESDIVPRLGENVVIRFEACSPIQAFVRWARDGRIGLNFGCEMVLG